MKKFLAKLLVFVLIFSFAACNGGSDEETTTAKQPYKENHETIVFEDPVVTEPKSLFKLVKAKDYNLKEGKPNTNQTSKVTFIANRYDTKQKNYVCIIPENVSIGETKLVLNETVLKDILANGWTIDGKVTEDKVVAAGKNSSVIIKNSKNEIAMLSVTNKTSSDLALSECVITAVSYVGAVKSDFAWSEITLGKKVTTKATYADVIKELGAPKAINVVEYYEVNDYKYCKATLIYEQKKDDVTYSVSISFTDDNKTLKVDSFAVEAK